MNKSDNNEIDKLKEALDDPDVKEIHLVADNEIDGLGAIREILEQACADEGDYEYKTLPEKLAKQHFLKRFIIARER